MTHFSNDEADCRVDIFKPNGKWYTTTTINMSHNYNSPDLKQSIKDLLLLQKWDTDNGWIFVCLEPYHQHAHPIMLKENRSD